MSIYYAESIATIGENLLELRPTMFLFASGDSFNDTGMLKQADKGCFFCAPDSIVAQFPQLEATKTYKELLDKFHKFQESL